MENNRANFKNYMQSMEWNNRQTKSIILLLGSGLTINHLGDAFQCLLTKLIVALAIVDPTQLLYYNIVGTLVDGTLWACGFILPV